MTDLASVKQLLQNDANTYRLHKPDNCINTALTKMWNNENVVMAMIFFSNNVNCSLLLLTDKNRLIIGNENQTERKGRLFDTTQFDYSSYAYDMTGVDGNKTRCIVRKESGFLGATYYDVIFEGQQQRFTLTFTQQAQANKVMQAVLDNAKRCEKPEPTSAPTSAPASTGNSAIAEIRKMYEDGIIDKAEMLDLIKSLNK